MDGERHRPRGNEPAAQGSGGGVVGNLLVVVSMIRFAIITSCTQPLSRATSCRPLKTEKQPGRNADGSTHRHVQNTERRRRIRQALCRKAHSDRQEDPGFAKIRSEQRPGRDTRRPFRLSPGRDADLRQSRRNSKRVRQRRRPSRRGRRGELRQRRRGNVSVRYQAGLNEAPASPGPFANARLLVTLRRKPAGGVMRKIAAIALLIAAWAAPSVV